MTRPDDRGLILMPDISGYTAFVHAAHPEHAQAVVSTLLEALLQAEQLGLELRDIEGDALFSYRAGAVPACERIMDQVTRWNEAFHEARRRYQPSEGCRCGACGQLESLSLKVVAHYGRVRVQKIGPLHKLFGADVILAHRLLKNSLPLHSYFLFTGALAERCGRGVTTRFGCVRHEEDYPVFGPTMLNVIRLPNTAGGAVDPDVVRAAGHG
jgi:hypothetical protein